VVVGLFRSVFSILRYAIIVCLGVSCSGREKAASEHVPKQELQTAETQIKAEHTRILKSGKSFHLIGIVQRRSEGPSSSLFVDYVTTLPIRDRHRLIPEVVELWCDLRTESEQTGVARVFVVATDARIGGAVTSFALHRQPDGSWLLQGEPIPDCQGLQGRSRR
jgi:hypothetical protein